MLFQTTAAHEELRAKIRSFAEEEIQAPRIFNGSEQRVSRGGCQEAG